MTSTTLSIRLSDETKTQLGLLATATRRSKSFLAAEAVAAYVAREQAIIAGIERGLADMKAGRTVPHDEAMHGLDVLIGETEQIIPYHGQPILHPDSFLRKLPQILVIRKRLEFDAIVMASDIITNSFNTMRLLAIEIGPDTADVSEAKVSIAIGACWAIVNQLHAIRQLISSGLDPSRPLGPKTTELLRLLSDASMLRNKMDHLKNNLGNISNKSGKMSPLFGSISYFYAIG